MVGALWNRGIMDRRHNCSAIVASGGSLSPESKLGSSAESRSHVMALRVRLQARVADMFVDFFGIRLRNWAEGLGVGLCGLLRRTCMLMEGG